MVLVATIVTLALSFRSKARDNQAIGADENALATLVAGERKRGEDLVLTLTHAASDDYVAEYARNEGGMLLPGENRIVPLPHPVPPTPTPIPPPTVSLSTPQTPLDAWWMLFFRTAPPGTQSGEGAGPID